MNYFNKKLFQFYILLQTLGFLIVSSNALAEKMNLEAHDLVISKLESTLKNIKQQEDNSIDLVGLKIQLANLYSEKARLLLLEEGKQSCDNCLHSLDFRKKAISLYSSINPNQLDNDGGQTSLQLAYLLDTSNSNLSLSIYDRLIKNSKTTRPNLIKAYIKRAEHYFRNGLFSKSILDYKTALSLASTSEHNPILHKIAWAKFNSGDFESSYEMLIQILNSINAHSKKFNYAIDDTFQFIVAKDLALFITKVNVTSKLLEKVFLVMPNSERSNNLLYFSEESERIGSMDNAVLAWEILIRSKDIKEEHKLSALLGLARFNRDTLQFSKAQFYFTQALEVSKTPTELSVNNLKQFLTSWEKQIKKFTKKNHIKESQSMLLLSYENYLKYFNNNYDVFLWHAQLALKLNQSDKALNSYSRSSELIFDQLKNEKNNNTSTDETSSNSPNNKLRNLLNNVLITEVSLAEKSNKFDLKLIAYNHYLNLNQNGPEGFNVRYQKAKLYYDKNDTIKSYELFDEIATDNQFTNSDLKIKAAHLALDCLALKSDISKLEEKSIEYAKRFPKHETEFKNIAFNAGMDITHSLVNNNQSQSASEKALDKLNSIGVDQSSISKNDFKKFLKTKIELEIKSNKWSEALKTITQFYSLKSINSNEKIWALKKELTISEFILDFKASYKTLLKLNYQYSQNPNELLKGALLAELSQHDVVPWLEKVVKSRYSSKEQVALARSQIVRHSSNPWKALHLMSPHLKNKPHLFSSLALECYSLENRPSEIPWILSFSGVKNTWQGKTLQRVLIINEIKSLSQTKFNQPLNSRNDSLLSKSIKNRVILLNSLEKKLAQFQKASDWTLELIVSIRLQNENLRLASEIELLPAPKNIKNLSYKKYQKELSQIANPFKKTASALQNYIDGLWRDKSYINNLIHQIDTNDKIRPILMKELNIISSFAPSTILDEVKTKLDELKNRPSTKDIALLQLELQKDPQDSGIHNQLLNMAKKRGNQSMIVFLQARGQNLKGDSL